MKRYLTYLLILATIIAVNSCEKDNDIDKTRPVIDLDFSDAFPINCDTLYFGETFIFKALFTDNAELGSFSIDIHNNFDHHSHTTEVSECNLNPVKDPVNPYVIIDDYEIPEGLTKYTTNISITIPSGNTDGKFDSGDYHFFISLTDHEGWSTQQGLSIKILHREK